MKTTNTYGLGKGSILLPSAKVEIKKWPVVACDQYTQDRAYWTKVSEITDKTPSTAHIILPEVYLADSDKSERIQNIQKTMKEYLNNDIFMKDINGMIYLERTTAYGRTRKGLITTIDLEEYEWKPFSKAKIRATEATIVDRIPPRMEIRRGAALESPHIMLLVNDSNKSLVEKTGQLTKAAQNSAPVYNTDLMQNSGHITGWEVNNADAKANVEKSLEEISKKNICSDGSLFMFAVGDGNHSLATAKAVWEEFKEKASPEEIENHPARYALVEIVNIFDEGLTFEPIHRVLFNVDSEKLMTYVAQNLGGNIEKVENAAELEEKVKKSTAGFGFVCEKGMFFLNTPVTELAVSRLQPVLDDFLKSGGEIDYIHGSEEVFRLGGKDGGVSILLPPIAKESFFTTISGSGPLPRKSFSMGEASEKRFYMECRKLFY
jgi:uncharacterized protein (DUF1015 family)